MISFEVPASHGVRFDTVSRRTDDAVADLLALQAEYAAWYEGLPDNLRDNPTGEALEIIVDLDLDALAAIVPPRGYGRDRRRASGKEIPRHRNPHTSSGYDGEKADGLRVISAVR
jgi:hypothetical protein